MTRHSSPAHPALTRRRMMQHTVQGTAGLLAWHQGWAPWPRAWAQKGQPSGQMTWAIHATLVPSWFDPAETPGIITPFMCLYALHDALIKPMPDGPMTPCLATQWRESADGLTYDFELRQGVTFHNGDPFTAEDVKFSFELYSGAGATDMKKRVKTVEIVPRTRSASICTPLARFHGVLCYPSHGGLLDRPQAVHRKSRR